MSVSTPSSSGTKKSELSSPEFTVDLKKNRIYSGSQSESDISDISGLSIPEENSMATQMESTDAASEVAGSESSLLTLQETHLKQLASLMEKSFQPQISQIIKDSFQTQISELVTSIVSGVLEGLTNKLSFLESENKKLLSENSELRVKVLKLEDAVNTAEQYSRRNCLRFLVFANNQMKVPMISSLVLQVPSMLILTSVTSTGVTVWVGRPPRTAPGTNLVTSSSSSRLTELVADSTRPELLLKVEGTRESL